MNVFHLSRFVLSLILFQSIASACLHSYQYCLQKEYMKLIWLALSFIWLHDIFSERLSVVGTIFHVLHNKGILNQILYKIVKLP